MSHATNDPTTAVTHAASRLTSLDALRGITVATMLLVNNPGSWSHIHAPFEHAAWNGCTLADLVFPFFLFTVGASMAFSFPRALARGESRTSVLLRAAKRGLILILLGIMLNALSLIVPRLFGAASPPPWDHFRFPGVLQRIGVVFILAAPLVLWLKEIHLVQIACGVLLGYGLLLGSGSIDPAANPTAQFDRWLFTANHLYKGGPFDPEGLGSTATAVVSTLLGHLLAHRVVAARNGGRSGTRLLVMGGAWLTLAGLSASLHSPMNKALWSSSYTLFTAGLASLCWALLHELLDVRGWTRLGRPAVVFGSNAIFAFVASGVVGRLIGAIPVRTGDASTSLREWLYMTFFQPIGSAENSSLLFALANVVAWYAVHLWLDLRKIHFKV